MIMGDISKLAQSIQESAMPGWLREYFDAHRDRVAAELKLFGSHEIPMPDGGKIIIRRK